MKTAFICNQKNKLNSVYPENVLNTLKTTAGFDGVYYIKEEVLENPDNFKDTEYIFSTWGMPSFTEDEIKKYFPVLKCVFYAAGTVQEFARPFLKCGVKVFSAWAANAVPVAEYTVSQIVLANKGYFKTSVLASDGNRDKAREIFSNYAGNYDVKIGIIGAGMIGSMVIEMLKVYKLEVLAFDPFLSDERAKELGCEKVSLKRLFSECNVVSNHLANNAQTKGMLTGELFSAMLPYATFINTGRGAQIVEEDLIKVLGERPDLTALLDVTDPEPPIPNSEFFSLSNCILTPHIAGSSGNEVHRMAEYMLKEFEKYKANEKCLYEVNLKMLETMA